ncbi:MAG: archease [Candidatus Norongarragalinales archaeon]
MKRFAFFEHTADVLFEAYGKTLKECVENAASAMFSVMAKPRLLKKTVKTTVKNKGSTLDEIVVFLLDKMVSESDARQAYWKEFKVKKIDEKRMTIEGIAYGSPYARKAAGTHVKAVTMHRARVFKNDKGVWVARIVLDI